MLTQEILKARLVFVEDTGVFLWRFNPEARKQWNAKHVGNRAGCTNKLGYIIIRLDKLYLAHRLVWFYVHGVWPKLLDHIDREPANNRISNLREVSQSVNMHNTIGRGKYGKGVTKIGNRYQARIMIERKMVHLGWFATSDEAARAYSDFAGAMYL